MPNENDLDYISNVLSEAGTKLQLTKKKVKHGKLSIQRKKIKSQVLKDSKPRDLDREKICKNARKKAHGTVADTRRNISNHVRKGLHESEPLVVVNPEATTISEAFNFDFMEEANGANVTFEFFDKPIVTPISESIDIGLTPTGRKRKCRAIGVAEGCFQPITTPDGERVFSRNKRLYDIDHWQYQLENRGVAARVARRDMAGTIGHHDKRVDDADFASEEVSHIVTDLEIREDETNGIYLWGRLEILNTRAGRALKTYYESDIPLYVSSRGGGKLIELPGKDYKKVDKTKYFCETFDVVRYPGFLEAMPIYYNVLSEDEEDGNLDTSESLESKLSSATQEEEYSITEEDNNMSKANCTITADTNINDIADKLLKPMSEKLAELTETVAKISSDIYESEEVKAEEVPAVEEAPKAEEPAEEVEAPAEEIKEEAEEPKAEEAPVEEAPKAEEPEAEKIEEHADEEQPAEEAQAEEVPADEQPAKEIEEETEVVAEDAEEAPKAEEVVAKEPKAEEAEAPAEEIKEGCDCGKCDDCKAKEAKGDKKEAKEEKKDAKAEAPEEIKEEWAKEDPKETAPATNDPHLAKQGKAETPMKGDVYAGEPIEAAPEVKAVADATKAPKEVIADEKKPAVKDAVITEEAEETEAPAEAGEVQVIDYKAMYEAVSNEVNDAMKVIDEMIETFRDFGKRHKEIVESKQSEISAISAQLNSYKLSEKFNLAVEEASKMLSSKTYDEVVEELKAEEATKVEEEAQATVEKVSESLEETVQTKAPAPRATYSVFSAPKQEVISEEVTEEIKKPRVFSWF